MAKNLKKTQVKITGKKLENFQELAEALIKEGFDISFFNQQTKINLYLPESTFSISLDINGKWSLE